MKFAFIQEHRHQWPIAWQCEALGVSDAGFYAWRQHSKGPGHLRRQALVAQVRRIHQEVRGCYGSPRMHQELLALGFKCSVNMVAQLMRKEGIRAKQSRSPRPRTTDSSHRLPAAANLLKRQFRPAAPNQAWVGDITYIPTAEGWLYLAVVEDLFSRAIVGWSMDTSMTSRLVVDALAMAIERRLPAEGLLAHTDRGSQYASEHYQRLLAQRGITCSMSEVAQCWDNAPAESFFATLKKELVYHEDFRTCAQARAAIFEYLEVFYNRRRRHSTLGYVSPAQFEASELNARS